MKTSLLARLSLGAVLLPSALLLGALPAQAGPVTSGETADWLVAQLTDGLAPGPFSPVDAGLTADVAVALDALGADAPAADVAQALAGEAVEYTTFGDDTSVFAGPAGKVASVVQLTGGDVRSVDGLDLLERLQTAVTVPDQPVGSAHDVYSFDGVDYADDSNTIDQTWVTRALVEADDPLADEALGHLVSQQCPSGVVRLQMADTPCSEEPGFVSLDTTAFALDVLTRARSAGVTVDGLDAAITGAADALEAAQARDGSLADAGTANTNSTGLAAAALAAAGRTDAALSAAEWLAGLRVARGTTGPLSDEVGAIAYDQAAFTAGTSTGISESGRDQWLRATAQAALALPQVPDAADPSLSARTGAGRYAAPGQEVPVQVDGLRADEAFEVSGGSAAVGGTADDDGRAEVTVVMPAEPGEVTLTLTGGDASRSATTALEVLAPAALGVDAPEQATAGEPVDVDVDGAAVDEPLTAVFVAKDSDDVAAPAAAAGPVALDELVAPREPGSYVVEVTSAVADRSGTSEALAVVTADAEVDQGAEDGDSGTGSGTGAGQAPGADGGLLPAAGALVASWWTWAALGAILVGVVLIVVRRRTEVVA